MIYDSSISGNNIFMAQGKGSPNKVGWTMVSSGTAYSSVDGFTFKLTITDSGFTFEDSGFNSYTIPYIAVK